MTALPAATALLAVACLIAACGGGSAQVETAPDRFAGMDRRALNACAGPPSLVEEEQGQTVLVYQMSSSRSVEIPRPDAAPGRPGSSPSALPPPPSFVYRRDCAARFVISDGRVVASAFQGVGAGGRSAPEACAAFVQRCLRAR